MSRSVGSRRLVEESGSSGHLRKRTSLGTAKVKFIPIEKALKMSSGAQKVELPSPSKLHSSSIRIDTMETMSRRASTELKSTPQKNSSQNVKETYKNLPAGHLKLSGHGSEKISSITPAQEPKCCTELKCKITLTSIAWKTFVKKFGKHKGQN